MRETLESCARPGEHLVIGVHLYGSQFKAPDGCIKHGVQLIADQVLQGAALEKETYR